MAVIHLIRHAAHDLLGQVLVGRMAGVHLSTAGLKQAAALGRYLAREPLNAVFSSPRERALETARAIATACGCPAETADELDEIDFGAWTGRSFAELQHQDLWHRYNAYRSSVTAPGGESLLAVQLRLVGWLERQRTAVGNSVIAAVSHADVIKATIAHYLGLHLDLFQRLDVAPASITSLQIEDWGPRLLRLNETLPAEP